MYVHTYVCIYVCMYVHAFMYVCMYACMYVCISYKTTFNVKMAWSNKVESYECAKRLATTRLVTRFDIRMQPRFSILNT